MAEDEDYELEVQSIGRLLSRTDLVKVIDDDGQDINIALHDYDSIKDNTRELDLLPLYSIAASLDCRYDKSSMNIAQAVLYHVYDVANNEWDGSIFDSFKTKSEELLGKINSKPLHDLYVEPVGEILKMVLPLLLIVLLSKQINDTYIIRDTIEEYAGKEDYMVRIKTVADRYASSFQGVLDEDKQKVIRLVNALIRGGTEEDIA